MKYEIWLNDNYGYFEHGIAHLDSGRTEPLEKYIHSATFGPDSLLVGHKESSDTNEYLLRWFIREKTLNFYRIGSEMPDIIFHNNCPFDITLKNYGVLKSGTTIALQMKGSHPSSICPKCNQHYTGVPALSRKDNKTLICPDCGTREALEIAGVPAEEQAEIIKEIHRKTRP